MIKSRGVLSLVVHGPYTPRDGVATRKEMSDALENLTTILHEHILGRGRIKEELGLSWDAEG